MNTTTMTEESNNDNYNDVVVLLRARAREADGHKATETYKREIDAYADYWRLATGNMFPPEARRRFGLALAHGTEPALLADIIDQTAAAPRPSWAYCAAIMDRLEREGIATQADYRAAQARRRAAMRPDTGNFGRNSGQDAQNYEQRRYDNAKLAYLYEDN